MIRFLKSFKNAFNGIIFEAKNGRNFRVQIIAAIYCLSISPFFLENKTQWAVVIILCTLVLSAELFNAAIEKNCDRITTEYDEKIKNIKDMAAGAVLILSVCSVAVAAVFFANEKGINRFFDYCKDNIWYPLVLVIFIIPSIVFIKGKKN